MEYINLEIHIYMLSNPESANILTDLDLERLVSTDSKGGAFGSLSVSGFWITLGDPDKDVILPQGLMGEL